METATVFLDDLSLTGNDPDYSMNEDRFVIFGVSNTGRLLVVSFVERGDRSESSTPGRQPRQKENFMKKLDEADMESDELRPEYRREDFGPMVRGKYAARMRESSNIVVLDPDIAEVFPNSEAVNQALRNLLELARRSVHNVER